MDAASVLATGVPRALGTILSGGLGLALGGLTAAAIGIRTRRQDDGLLTGLVAELQACDDPGAVAEAVCRRVAATFGFHRVLLLGAPVDRDPELLGSVGVNIPVRVKVVLQRHSIVRRAQARGEILAVAGVDSDTDPWLAGVWRDEPAVIVPLMPNVQASGAIVAEPATRWGRRRSPRVPRPNSLMRVAAYTTLALRNTWLLQQANRSAATDGLTGIANRRSFDAVLARELSRAERAHEPLSLLMIDLDHFKQLNDDLGHQAGDLVLRQMGELLVANSRTSDTAARYGGEEFAVVLPACPLGDAVELAGRIHRAVEGAAWPRPVTVSVGVASFPDHGLTGFELVGAADAALYRAKEGGRNQVQVPDASAVAVGPD